jgi:Tfp pilus assembly protein PilF
MRKRFANVCVVLISALALPGVCGQSVSGNTVIGKVRRQSGQPVSNVLVQLETGIGVMVTQTVTTNEGDFAFSGLAGASFKLIVNEPGHEPFAERVEFPRSGSGRPGETRRIDIVLTESPRRARPVVGTVFRQDIPDAALKAYRRGVKLVDERRSEEGISALCEAIKVLPSYFDAHFALALEMIRLRRYVDAIAELEKARSVNPRDGRLYQAFGLIQFEQKNYRLAEQSFAASAQLQPNNPEANLMRGAALIELGQLVEAEKELRRAFQISDQKLSVVHLHLARIYEKRSEFGRAADELDAYLESNPNVSNAQALRDAASRLRSSNNKR